MAKTIMDAMKQELLDSLEGVELEVVEVEHGSRVNKDGVEEKFTRLNVEIPRGNGKLSRCRMSCKTNYAPNLLSLEDVEDGVSVCLKGLSVSYIDSRGTVYFKCDSFEVV